MNHTNKTSWTSSTRSHRSSERQYDFSLFSDTPVRDCMMFLKCRWAARQSKSEFQHVVTQWACLLDFSSVSFAMSSWNFCPRVELSRICHARPKTLYGSDELTAVRIKLQTYCRKKLQCFPLFFRCHCNSHWSHFLNSKIMNRTHNCIIMSNLAIILYILSIVHAECK